MRMDYTSFLLFPSFLCCLCLAAILLPLRKKKKTRLPPGPFPLPIIGSLFKLGAKPYKSLEQLAKIHGPLMTLKLGSVTTVIASSPAMAQQILQKHDQVCASRTIPDALRALSHHEFAIAWQPPTSSHWRNYRRILKSEWFAAEKLESNQTLRYQKVGQLLAHVEENSKKKHAVNIGQAAFSTVLNLISSTVFSKDFTSLDSGYGEEFKALVWGVMEEGARPNFSDYFPSIRRMDLQGIRGRMAGHFGKLDDLFDGIIKQRLEARRELKSSSNGSSDFLDKILDYKQEDGFGFSDPSIKSMLKDIFIAGTDTTSSTLEWAMTELIRNPKTMIKAKLELKEKFNNDKPIDESDVVSLPYLQAIVKETLRLHPPVPLLLPHKAESNVEIGDFIVPKNAQILVNLWTIGRDPNIWADPTLFSPERFLNSNLDFKGRNFEFLPFGAGRRICPGYPLAYRMVYLMLASLLHLFNWKLEEGLKPEDMDMEDKFGLTLQKASPLMAIPTKI